MFPDVFWSAPKVVLILRFLGWFGGFYGLISLMLLLLRRERLLGVSLFLCFSTSVAVAAYQERISALIDRDRIVAQYNTLRDRFSGETDPNAATQPEAQPTEKPPAPPPPPPPVEEKDPTEGMVKIADIFAGRGGDLTRKAIARIFDGMFGGKSARFDGLAPVHQQTLTDRLKPLLIVKVKEEGSRGRLADVYFDPDSFKEALVQQGYSFRKVRIAFVVKENFAAGVDEARLGESVAERIRARSKYYLGDGFYTEEHRLLSELKSMEFKSAGGAIFRVSALNPNPYFDLTRDVQTIELRVF